LLLKEGCSVDAKEEHGKTPLHCAANKGHRELLLLLLSNGADINAKDLHGRTPLHYAAQQGGSLVWDLVNRGADIAAKDVDGRTTMDYAQPGWFPSIRDGSWKTPEPMMWTRGKGLRQGRRRRRRHHR